MVTQRFLADPMVHQRYCVKVQRQDFFGAYNSLPALRPLKIPVGLLRTIWNLLVFRPAIVHVHTSYGSGFLRDGLIALIMKGAGRKVVMTFHSGWGGTLMRIYQEGSGWLRRLTHFVLPKMDALVANGTSYQRFLQDTFGHRNIHVLPNPVTDDHIPHILPPYSGRKPIAFFAGLLDQRKGVFEVLKAAEELPEVEFIIAGTAFDMAPFMKAYEGSKVKAQITLIPEWISAEKVFEYMQQARVLLLPSWGETMPLILEEAIVFGLPVITTPVGVIPDYVQDGVHGHLIEPGDVPSLIKAIRHVIEDEAWAEKVAQANLVYGKQFLSSVVHPKQLQVYDSVLDSHRAKGVTPP